MHKGNIAFKKVGIDGRLWYESGVGRYIRNLVSNFGSQKDLKYEFVVFLSHKAYDEVEFQNPQIRKVRANVAWHGISEQWKFKRMIEKENPDLMHFPYFSYPVFYRKPFVITIHDLILDHYPTGKASSLPLPFFYAKHYAYKKVTKVAVKNSRKIIVPSSATKKELMDHYHADDKKINVIYEGFDNLIASGKEKKLVSNNFILYVGNAYPHKNLQRLLNAFQIVRRTMDIELVCIGRSDFFYKRLENQKNPGVHFLHDVDDSTLFHYYTDARLMVAPSLMEGFGLPIVEAMSLACPTVCSDIDVFREICKDAVVYFDPKQENDIAIKIISVLKDEKLQHTLIEKGKLRVKNYSWEKCSDETLKLYESSIGV